MVLGQRLIAHGHIPVHQQPLEVAPYHRRRLDSHRLTSAASAGASVRSWSPCPTFAVPLGSLPHAELSTLGWIRHPPSSSLTRLTGTNLAPPV